MVLTVALRPSSLHLLSLGRLVTTPQWVSVPCTCARSKHNMAPNDSIVVHIHMLEDPPWNITSLFNTLPPFVPSSLPPSLSF